MKNSDGYLVVAASAKLAPRPIYHRFCLGSLRTLREKNTTQSKNIDERMRRGAVPLRIEIAGGDAESRNDKELLINLIQLRQAEIEMEKTQTPAQ